MRKRVYVVAVLMVVFWAVYAFAGDGPLTFW